MKILYFGKSIRGIKCLEALVENGRRDEIIGVVTPPGMMDEMAQKAKKMGFQILQPERVNGEECIKEISSLNPDLFILSGYSYILKKEILSIPPMGAINLHGGKLPEYRGVAPINWQIINGEAMGGCAILFVDEGIDTGDIIAQELYDITMEDTAATVLEKTLELFPSMLVNVLDKIEKGTVKRLTQDLFKGCYYTRRYPRDGKIVWKEMTAVQIYNLVRALVKPYPGAFFFHRGKKIIVNKVSLLQEDIRGMPGRVSLFRGEGVIVIARNRGIVIEEISLDGEMAGCEPRTYFKSPGDDLD